MTSLADQVAVVTGASSGIGEAIALGLATEGATLCLVGRNLGNLELVAERARTTAHGVFTYQIDLTRDQDIHDLTARLSRDVGVVDLLVHSAGVFSFGRIDSDPIENLDQQYRTNLRAPYALTKALLPLLRSRRGQVVFINSSRGVIAGVGASQYAATKHALKALADSLREEVNADGVRVLSVFLGRTASPMQATIHKLEGKAYHPERLLQPDDVASVVIHALCLPRTAEVTDMSIRPMLKPT